MYKLTKIVAMTAAFAGFGSVALSQNIGALPPLPPFENAAQEPAMAALGKMLYFDTRLSGDGSTSCADCHNPASGFGDGSELSRGYPSSKHWRNSQTLVNSAFIEGGLHWDGSVPSLLDQVPGAMGTPFAHNINVVLAEERLRQVPAYVEQFDEIWGEAPTIDAVAQAIAAYERTLISADSSFDRFVAGDHKALSQSEIRGFQLFSGKANCSQCHNGGLATDEKYHNTTVPKNVDLFDDPEHQITFRTAMRGFGVPQEEYMSFERDPGRYAYTMDKNDLGAFRTAPLRYLKFTAPYMHNGYFYTLEEVVEFYNKGGTTDVFGTKSPLIKPLGLTPGEQADLVAFLESMSGTEITEDAPELPEYGRKVSVPQIASNDVKVGVTPVHSGITSSSEGLVIFSDAAAPMSPSDGEEHYVIVAENETLGQIARREYGDVLKYLDILKANDGLISDPNQVPPGTKLLIP